MRQGRDGFDLKHVNFELSIRYIRRRQISSGLFKSEFRRSLGEKELWKSLRLNEIKAGVYTEKSQDPKTVLGALQVKFGEKEKSAKQTVKKIGEVGRQQKQNWCPRS